CLLVYSGPWVF
nr:immunoglobulin light chain junction region [Macaca mulatta]